MANLYESELISNSTNGNSIGAERQKAIVPAMQSKRAPRNILAGGTIINSNNEAIVMLHRESSGCADRTKTDAATPAISELCTVSFLAQLRKAASSSGRRQ